MHAHAVSPAYESLHQLRRANDASEPVPIRRKDHYRAAAIECTAFGHLNVNNDVEWCTSIDRLPAATSAFSPAVGDPDPAGSRPSRPSPCYIAGRFVIVGENFTDERLAQAHILANCKLSREVFVACLRETFRELLIG